MERRSAPRTPRSAMSAEDLEADLAETLTVELPPYLAANEMGGFVCDLGSARLFFDPGALAVFDFQPGEFDGRLAALYEHVVPEDLPGVLENVTAAVSGPGDYGAYFRARHRDGSTPWVHAQASIQRDGKGTPLRAVGIVRNADAELAHAAEQTLLASERRLQTDVVHAITAELSRVLTVDDLLEFLTSQSFLDMFNASGVALGVVDQDRRRLLATTGLPAALLRDIGVARVDSPLPIAEAIRAQTPLFVTREEVRERYPVLWPYIESTDLTATAILPLAAQAQPTGALAILYKGKREFSPEERNLLLTLGATFSQSLQRALLYDQEHAISVALQQAMLPTRIPEVEGLRLAVRYQPTTMGQQVGGDWYDVIAFADGKVGLVVGDVQGHDVNAAAVMGQLRAAVRAYAMEERSSATVMARVSNFLRDLDTDLIATCVCVHLDPATGSARVVRAGHPCPIVRGADRRSARLEVPGGVPLGLPRFAEQGFPTTEVQLAPGDTILLCTDGLLESYEMDIDTGIRRIQDIMDEGPEDLDELADRMIATVEERQRQQDDVALLLARIDGPADGAGDRGR